MQTVSETMALQPDVNLAEQGQFRRVLGERDAYLPLIDHAILAISRISRSFNGESNTDSSPLKRKLLLEGSELSAKVKENFRATLLGLLIENPPLLKTPSDVENLVLSIQARLNSALVPSTFPVWREWNTLVAHHPDTTEIRERFNSFTQEFLDKLQSKADVVDLASWTEKRFNAEDHPLSDACSRTSRALACWVLAKEGIKMPQFASREEYFRQINKSMSEWADFYRSQIPKN